MGRKFSWIGMFATTLLVAACGAGGRPAGLAVAPQSAFTAQAAEHAGFRVAGTTQSRNWERIERLTDSYADFPVEHARPNGRQEDPEIVKAFGTDMPPSRDVLLHYAKGWDAGQGTPVLLVHGSIVDANSSWVDPHGKPGLAKMLVSKGFRVFAVTFAHRHGDNELWAEQIANAIARIRQVTGAAQVDVVAHSKGCVAARALVENVKLPWMAPYRGDIRKLVMLGGPQLGLDYPFRHPTINFGLYPEKDETLFNAPMSWTRMLVMSVWVDTTAQSIMKDGGDYFPGQDQMLARFDKEYPLPETEQDWYTTYYGGQGFVSASAGIDKAIAQGGHFIDKLRKAPVDPRVQLAVLAGDQASMTNILNETSGPSDGIVFLKSATYTDDLTRGGAKLIAKQVLHCNHMDLVISPEAHNWVAKVLAP